MGFRSRLILALILSGLIALPSQGQTIVSIGSGFKSPLAVSADSSRNVIVADIGSASAGADVIALAATSSHDGIAHVPTGGGAFAVATSNAGATEQLTVSADTGSAVLPVRRSLCQTSPSTGHCLATPAATVALNDTARSTPTFAVFLQATGTIPFAPGASRVFVRFNDQSGGVHGSTGVAVETN